MYSSCFSDNVEGLSSFAAWSNGDTCHLTLITFTYLLSTGLDIDPMSVAGPHPILRRGNRNRASILLVTH